MDIKIYADCFGVCNHFIKKALSFLFLKVTTTWNKQTSWLHPMLQQGNGTLDQLITTPQFNTHAWRRKKNANSY